uniref:transposase n=2 Tax=Pseudonocardiaceae TaxID=2070 RepID=UPI000F7972CC
MRAPRPPEFRRRAVELARQGEQPIAVIAKDLGISESCLRRWMAIDDVDTGRVEGVSSSERAELVELRRRNRVLEMEVEILKRASLDSTGQRNTPQVVDHDRGGRWHAWAGRGCPMRTALICGSAGGAGSRSVTSLGRSSGPRVQCSRCSSRAGAMFRRHAGADRGR